MGMLEVIELNLYMGMLVFTWTTDMLEVVLTLYLRMLVVIETSLYLDNGHAGSAIPLPWHASSHRVNLLPGQRTCWTC